jgi:hypothetical protein
MTQTLWIDGMALWSPAMPGWSAAQAALQGQDLPAAASAARPTPEMLAANERRRAPDSVLLALEVAQRALAASGHAAADVASVFSSAHGDLAITDALCRTLASDPLLLSPMRFHHSVHNAASGYWAIGSGSRAASTALSADATSFASGLLEAAVQCLADRQLTMLVAFDTQACGPLMSVNRSRGLLAAALVLAPAPGPRSRWRMQWSLQPGHATEPRARSAAARALVDNASASALPLMEVLAAGQDASLAWPLSDSVQLQLTLQALAGSGLAPLAA